MKQWRRRNRNTFARGLGGKSLGRRYADDLPYRVNAAFDAIIAHFKAVQQFTSGGGSAYRVDRAESMLTQAINNLKL